MSKKFWACLIGLAMLLQAGAALAYSTTTEVTAKQVAWEDETLTLILTRRDDPSFQRIATIPHDQFGVMVEDDGATAWFLSTTMYYYTADIQTDKGGSVCTVSFGVWNMYLFGPTVTDVAVDRIQGKCSVQTSTGGGVVPNVAYVYIEAGKIPSP